MTIYYVDPIGGSESNDGLSFATRRKTPNGLASSGDVVRFMASPEPTSIGNATWYGTATGSRTSVSIASSTNASPIVITVSALSHGLVTGDYVFVGNHAINTNANGFWLVGAVTTTTFEILQIDGSNTTGNGVGGASGVMSRRTNYVIKLPTPLTKNVALCGGLAQKPLWTASTNVTTTQLASPSKEGYSCAQIAVNTTFTTGKAAYYTLPSTLDLSGYQQVSFWVRQSTGTLAYSNTGYLALCSDTAGNVVEHAAYINNITTLSSWTAITVDFGVNLSSNINSVAFYIAADNGAQTFQIDNIIACKASSSNDSVNIRSLISKNIEHDGWYSLSAINYNVLVIDSGYSNASETATTYKRETIVNQSTTSLVNWTDDGVNYVLYSGGWDRTDMSTQVGQTWYDSLGSANNAGFFLNSSRIAVERLNYTRSISGIVCNTANVYNHNIISGEFVGCNTAVNYQSISALTKIGTISTHNNGTNFAFAANSYGLTIDTLSNASNSNGHGINLTNMTNCKIGRIVSANNGSGNGATLSNYTYVGEINARENLYYAISFSGTMNYVGSGSSSGNISGVTVSSGTGLNYVSNFTATETQEATVTGATSGAVYFNRMDNVDNNCIAYTWMGSGVITQQTAVVDSPAVSAWKLSPVNSIRTGMSNPIKLKLGTIIVAAGSLVTVTARMRRTNDKLTMQLVCPVGPGVTNEAKNSMTAAANTWETVTISFTPNAAGAVDIYAQAYGGTTFSGYVCNMTVSQA